MYEKYYFYICFVYEIQCKSDSERDLSAESVVCVHSKAYN